MTIHIVGEFKIHQRIELPAVTLNSQTPIPITKSSDEQFGGSAVVMVNALKHLPLEQLTSGIDVWAHHGYDKVTEQGISELMDHPKVNIHHHQVGDLTRKRTTYVDPTGQHLTVEDNFPRAAYDYAFGAGPVLIGATDAANTYAALESTVQDDWVVWAPGRSLLEMRESLIIDCLQRVSVLVISTDLFAEMAAKVFHKRRDVYGYITDLTKSTRMVLVHADSGGCTMYDSAQTHRICSPKLVPPEHYPYVASDVYTETLAALIFFNLYNCRDRMTAVSTPVEWDALTAAGEHVYSILK